jgi:hypothetical protein
MTDTYYDDNAAEKLKSLPEINAFETDLTASAHETWKAIRDQNEKEQLLFLWN